MVLSELLESCQRFLSFDGFSILGRRSCWKIYNVGCWWQKRPRDLDVDLEKLESKIIFYWLIEITRKRSIKEGSLLETGDTIIKMYAQKLCNGQTNRQIIISYMVNGQTNRQTHKIVNGQTNRQAWKINSS